MLCLPASAPTDRRPGGMIAITRKSMRHVPAPQSLDAYDSACYASINEFFTIVVWLLLGRSHHRVPMLSRGLLV